MNKVKQIVAGKEFQKTGIFPDGTVLVKEIHKPGSGAERCPGH